MRTALRVLTVLAAAFALLALLGVILPVVFFSGDSASVSQPIVVGVIAVLATPSMLLALLSGIGAVLVRGLMWRPRVRRGLR